MESDKHRWNKKYETAPMPSRPIKAFEKIEALLKAESKALDIACGMGRHTNFLAAKKIYVDAVDHSDVALDKLDKNSYIRALDLDLDSYVINKDAYDLIVCTNFLSRRLFPFMKAGLKAGGLIVFETFVECEHLQSHQTSNIEYHLRRNELLHAFIGLEILFYEERIERNLRDEVVKIATLIAKK